MDDRELHDPDGPANTTQPDQQTAEPDAPLAASASAGLVTRLVFTALGGLVCVFLWPAGGQMTIVALVVMAVVVWFGPWFSESKLDRDDDSFTSPPEED